METEQNMHYNIQTLLFYVHYRLLQIHTQTMEKVEKRYIMMTCVI